jgi:diaminopimelate epimerase
MRNVEIPFVKLHGLGNDWIAVAGSDLHFLRLRLAEKTGFQGAPSLDPKLPAFARAVCDRHTGLGADGLIIVIKPKGKNNDALVRFFNTDGSEAEMSGNGIRCAAAFMLVRAAQALAFAPPELAIEGALRLKVLHIETAAGVRRVESISAGGGKWSFRVGMGAPVLEPTRIPFRAGKVEPPIVKFPLRLAGGTMNVTVTSMGNPHCSVLVDDFDALEWESLGREIERNDLFPNRTNVEFVKVVSRKQIEVRFWERGVGVTQSSGTGSCAAAVACILNGVTGRKVRVDTVAGSLEVGWPKNGEATLTGPAELIAEGTYHYGA